jgi:hypothetical protein
MVAAEPVATTVGAASGAARSPCSSSFTLALVALLLAHLVR